MTDGQPQPPGLQRRAFLKVSALAAGAIVVGIPLAGCSSADDSWPGMRPGTLQANAYLQIDRAGQITLFLPRVDMGQGTAMGFATLIAEELFVEPQALEIRHAGVHRDYGTVQVTGGSASMRDFYQPVRQAGANTRALLRRAAAQKLSVAEDSLRFADGHIIAAAGRHHYGEFVAEARDLELPDGEPLVADADLRLIGKQQGPRVDALAKITGAAEFGMDFEFQGMKKAMVLRCPVIGGTVGRSNAEAVLASSGVDAVFPISTGVAVLGDSVWQLKAALEQLSVEWVLPETLALQSSGAIHRRLQQALDEEGDQSSIEGQGRAALEAVPYTLTADYYVPYLAHATMEPMNCAVALRDEGMDLWVPTQAPGLARNIAAYTAGIDPESVEVHTPWLGGGFGRRLDNDYVAEAVEIARYSGEVVHLLWSREDDMQHDFYRPVSMARLQAGISADKRLTTWSIKRAGPNVLAYTIQGSLPTMLAPYLPDGFAHWLGDRAHTLFADWTVDFTSVDGLDGEYDITNREVRHVTVDPGLRLGSLRSVGDSFSGFFKESFIDEIAHYLSRDPLQFRLEYSQHNPRFQAVLRRVAELANWNGKRRPGRYLGLAGHFSFESYVAEIAEVSIDGEEIKVHKVYAAVDCGRVINPDIVKAQVESAVVYGLSAALYGEITLEQGAVQQSNFHDYPVLRMADCPAIEVSIIASQEAPTGIGEPGMPPIAAAVGNAVYAATGRRLRSLPFDLG